MARVYPVPSLLVRPFGSGIFTAVEYETEDHGIAGSVWGRTKWARRASDRTSLVYPVHIPPFVTVVVASLPDLGDITRLWPLPKSLFYLS